MDGHLQSFWVVWGYAPSDGRLIRLLVDGRAFSKCCCLEDGAFLPFVVPVESGMTELLRTKKGLLRSSSHFSFFFLFSWTTAYLAPLEISFDDFLVLFSSSNQS
jgi:hypothetical protein